LNIYKNHFLHLGCCLNVLKTIDSNSIDLILADPPYGTTQCKWDSIIPLNILWSELNRVIKKNGAIVLTSAQPFTTILISSNMSMFKYSWVWEKPHAKGHLNAKKRPMVAHEDVCVFYEKQPTYNPQKTFGHILKTSMRKAKQKESVYNKNTKDVLYSSTERYPRSVQVFKQDTQKTSIHPTQKPVLMMEYMIKTYSNKGDVVLDFCMGSGTTGVAAMNLNRKFVGIEKDKVFYDKARERIG